MDANRIPRKRRLRPVLIGVVVIFAAFAVAGVLRFCGEFKRVRTHGRALSLHAALRAYAERYGTPQGDFAAICSSLTGKNSDKIIFIVGDPHQFNARGEYLDEWGQPFRIEFTGPSAPRVRSLGPNGRDEGGEIGSDDIVSWR